MTTETMIGYILAKLVSEGADSTTLYWHRERLRKAPPHFVTHEYKERCGQFGWNVCYIWQRASFDDVVPQGLGFRGYNFT